MKKLSTKKIGNISAMHFMTQCIEYGWTVSVPLGDDGRYDCVLDRGNGLERVQVKTARYEDNVMTVHVVSKHALMRQRQQGINVTRRYIGQVDYIGVYCEALDKCYLVPMKDIGEKYEISLRIKETKNNQKKNIRYAKQYEI